MPHKLKQNMKIKKITFEASVHYYHHKRALENLEIYKDHVVIFPRQIVSWDGEAIAMAINAMTTNLNRKCLIPFRCKDKSQRNFWEKQNTKGEFVNQIKIKKRYDEIRDFLRLEALDLTMLRY